MPSSLNKRDPVRIECCADIGFDEPEDTMKRKRSFTVSDGEMVLILEPAEEGGFVVNSPMDPELITEAETLEEAFENARDARQALTEARAKLQLKFATPARG
jgi:antitoxin HicB